MLLAICTTQVKKIVKKEILKKDKKTQVTKKFEIVREFEPGPSESVRTQR